MPNYLHNNPLRIILPNFPNFNVTGIVIKLLGSLKAWKFNYDHTIMAQVTLNDSFISSTYKITTTVFCN